MNPFNIKPTLIKLLLVIILVVSGFIFGCETVPIVTKDRSQVEMPMPEVKSAIPAEEISTQKEEEVVVDNKSISKEQIQQYCFSELKKLPGTPASTEELNKICGKMNVYPECYSVNGDPIFHYEQLAKNAKKGKNILTISLIHGDEPASGTVARSWISRLDNLEPRNSWRVIPLANPDGFKKKTRMNVNGVDLNRNFPTEDWEESALKHWKVNKKADPRKFPGDKPASEIETQCLIKHIEDFKPDFIISIHTPYGVLDFDGPPMKFPTFKPLPWISLGNYPGSLGRYMWVNNRVPVLTIELKGNQGVHQLENFDKLQDISGTVAIQATKIINNVQEKTANTDRPAKNAN
ncbi:MAG: DUF2817 domain-containing protein [Bdellovibrionales bacterium]|nr:DUF2817 domain-containing protein [Bdellovibrionales bacterium]